jgi:hypothetical protein
MSREHLEAVALRAALEARELRQQGMPNRFFGAALFGFLLGFMVAAAGFLAGAALR